jgi:hypothetical protein
VQKVPSGGNSLVGFAVASWLVAIFLGATFSMALFYLNNTCTSAVAILVKSISNNVKLVVRIIIWAIAALFILSLAAVYYENSLNYWAILVSIAAGVFGTLFKLRKYI